MSATFDSRYQNDNGDAAIFGKTNAAVWVLTSAAGAFLAVRLWCRHHFSKLWWDDALLTFSWVILLVAAALLSRTISSGYETDSDKYRFFLFHNTETAMTTLATAWSKVAFAITLSRIVQNRYLKYFLWFVMVTANLVLVPGMISIWVPACVDPRKIYRPAHPACMHHKYLQYLGGSTIVYGGVVDVLLALCPWLIIRNLLLDTRDKIGLTVAMSLGAITGTIVIFRAFFQFSTSDNNYHFMVFMSIFNFLEPAVTVIAQAIPIFRVLVVKAKIRKGSGTTAVRISSLTTDENKASVAHRHSQRMRAWNSKHVLGEMRAKEPDDEELVDMRGAGRAVQYSSTLALTGSGGTDAADVKPPRDRISRHH